MRRVLLPWLVLLVACGRTPLHHGVGDPDGGQPDLPRLPDLTLSLKGDTKSPAAVIYIATVCNNGPISSPAATVDFYRDLASPPVPGQRSTLQRLVPSLGPSACSKLERLEDHVYIGVHELWAQVDAGGEVPEADESNNVAGPVRVNLVPIKQQPDLVASLTINPVGAGAEVELAASICNKGTYPSGASTIDFYTDYPSAPPASKPGDLTEPIPPLVDGACTNRSVVIPSPVGVHRAWAVVDRAGMVTESNELNNLAGPVEYGSALVKKPDLVVTKLFSYVTPSTSYVFYYLTACNHGQTYSSPSQVDLYINSPAPPGVGSSGDMSKSVITLAPGACISEMLSTQLPQGTYNSWAMIDPQDTEQESDEGNNLAGPISVTVTATAGVDLVVTNLTLSQTASGDHQFTATVCNKGTAASSTSVLDLYVNLPLPPDSWTLSNASKTVGQLTGGTCTSVSFTVGPLAPGSYSSWAWIDRKDFVPELDENNNLSGPFQFLVN